MHFRSLAALPKSTPEESVCQETGWCNYITDHLELLLEHIVNTDPDEMWQEKYDPILNTDPDEMWQEKNDQSVEILKSLTHSRNNSFHLNIHRPV